MPRLPLSLRRSFSRVKEVRQSLPGQLSDRQCGSSSVKAHQRGLPRCVHPLMMWLESDWGLRSAVFDVLSQMLSPDKPSGPRENVIALPSA
jgi:hypothetical protein